MRAHAAVDLVGLHVVPVGDQAGFPVVRKAQGVPDLMGDQLGEGLADEAVGLVGVGLDHTP